MSVAENSGYPQQPMPNRADSCNHTLTGKNQTEARENAD